MPLDYFLLSGIKTKQDFDRAEQEFQMKKQLANAELKKNSYLDADKLGEQAFMKAAMGQPLTPQEQAAYKFIDAKSGGQSFNPVTGEIVTKPRLSDKIGLPGQGMKIPSVMQGAANPPPLAGFGIPTPQGNGVDMSLPGYGDLSSTIPQAPVNEFDAAFEREMAAAAGNPKLQQSIKEKRAKDNMGYNEEQAKAAGFADRVNDSNPIFTDPKAQAALADPWQRGLASIPIAGNYLVSDDYQVGDQATRDYINALLRRESGAVISPGEFANANKQYIPQPGDSEEVLQRKEINRQNAAVGMARSAGPTYRPKTQAQSKIPASVDISKARQAKDGNWYAQDANGQYYKVQK